MCTMWGRRAVAVSLAQSHRGEIMVSMQLACRRRKTAVPASLIISEPLSLHPIGPFGLAQPTPFQIQTGFFVCVRLIVDRFIFSPRSLIHWKLCSPWMKSGFGGWSLSQNSTNGGNSSRPALFSSRQCVVQMAAFIKTRAYVNILKHRAVSPSQRALLLWPPQPMLGSNNYTKQHYLFIYSMKFKSKWDCNLLLLVRSLF